MKALILTLTVLASAQSFAKESCGFYCTTEDRTVGLLIEIHAIEASGRHADEAIAI